MTIPRTTVAPSRPTDPRLRRLAAMGVRWAEEPDPTGTAPGGDGEGSKEPKKGTHEDAAEYVKNGGDKGKTNEAKGDEGEKAKEQAKEQAETVSKAEYEALQQQLRDLQSQHETADEKAQREALAEAKSAGRKEATDKYAATMLRTAIRAFSPDLPSEELDELVEETNLAALVSDDGVDEEKLLRRAQRAAGTTTRDPGPDLGQGNRGGTPTGYGYEKGGSFHEARHGKSD